MNLELVLALVIFVVVGVPSIFLALQYLFGLRSSFGRDDSEGSRNPCVVLIPAHNESSIIADTLTSLKSQLQIDDRIVIVADNCSDNTADIGRDFGFEVLERSSDTERGKGYALDFGLQHIAKSPAATVVIFDADCEFLEGSLDVLVRASQRRMRVVQSLYLMKAPKNAPLKIRLAEFAWKVKNQIRPEGQKMLGLSCQLQGAGMAFPWTIITAQSLASGSIVEDLELGLKLSERGEMVDYLPLAGVDSYFPMSDEALETQRTRWEHGHLASIKELIPRFLGALVKGRLRAGLMMLDAMIPPTVLWLMISTLNICVAFVLFLFGYSLLFTLNFVPYLLMVFSLVLVWWIHGRSLVSGKDLFGVLSFILKKITLYKKISKTKEKKWVKTDRG
ncbi:glycosyltransferase family 2 protein [Corallincola spongiicola]|uniref:Glycosyltransferase n=1 Tax=Corallincola spongiicola TaxID=2520508 RepID=A0ABY1WSP1_9GAMM|nr:glycosyltransferase family 2 protein [Corallincola spongiicola]TAA47756.1 glycosyltransferase [Corallincola spongiicola]